MNYGFRHFHPLKGDPPDEFSGQGEDIAKRAREILSKRTLKEIKASADLLNYLFAESELRTWDSEKFRIETEEIDAQIQSKKPRKKAQKKPSYIDSEFLQYDGPSETRKLFLYRKYFDLSGYKPLPNATWHEIFAALALAFIDKACDDEKYYTSWHSEGPFDMQHHHRISHHVAWWIIDSMEAVAIAEGLKESIPETRRQDEVVKTTISLRAQSAAIAKHAKTAEAINALVSFGRQLRIAGKFKSKRHTVSAFLSSPQAHLADHLAASNRSRTLYEGYCKASDREPPQFE